MNEDLDNDLEGMYFVRMTKSHYYKKAFGSYATPKLYKLSDARRVVTSDNNKFPHHSDDDGAWEIVPVTFNIGEPVPLKKESK